MRFLEIPQWEVLDEVKTESTILDLMREDSRSLLLDFDYTCFNWADAINQKGLEYTQECINEFHKMSQRPNHLIFVCQHISVNKLDWGNALVFTPHASQEDNFYAIPHYAINFGDKKKIKNRKYKASFVGSFETHPSRTSIAVCLQDRPDCLIQNTGGWHFYGDNREEKEKFYCDTLSESQLCLAPRGTGPSTIRLWEGMASGCVPIVITDSSKLPLHDTLKWDEMIIRIQPHLTPIIGSIIDLLDEHQIEKRSKRCVEIYEKKFSNENLHISILETLEKHAE